MAAVDFITALGRVLHDGALRDAFAADASAFVRQIGLREADQSLFLRLVPADLEFQARVLLRKRFDLVRQLLPQTCREMGKGAWNAFANYGRSNAPKAKDPVVEDALHFSQYLRREHPEYVCMLELNRCRFVHEHRRLSAHLVNRTRNNWLPRLQVLFRRNATRRYEWQLYLSV